VSPQERPSQTAEQPAEDALVDQPPQSAQSRDRYVIQGWTLARRIPGPKFRAPPRAAEAFLATFSGHPATH
jgi:hypothetical protein